MSFEPYLQLLNGSGRKHTTIPADLAPISSDWGSRESCSSTRWRIFHAGFVGWSAERSRSSNERLSWDVAGCREWARQLESSAHPNRFSGRAAPRSRRLGSRRELPSVRLPYLRILPRHLDPFTASVPPFRKGKRWVSVCRCPLPGGDFVRAVENRRQVRPCEGARRWPTGGYGKVRRLRTSSEGVPRVPLESQAVTDPLTTVHAPKSAWTSQESPQ
jgi:hypothetical protein